MRNNKSKNIFNQLIGLLNEPIRDEFSIQKSFLTAFFIGLFISLFLYIFQPFGLDDTGSETLSYIIAYGVITFVVSFGFDLILGNTIRKDMPSWTLGKWIASTMLLILLIAIANYLYSWYKIPTLVFSLNMLLKTIYITFLVGLFPVVFIGGFRLFQNRLENLKIAESLTIPEHIEPATNHQPVNNKEALSTTESSLSPTESTNNNLENTTKYKPKELLFVEAMQNYVQLHYPNDQKEVIRITLTKVESELTETSLIRCHRSFLVNKDKIISVSGNAQGLKLKVEHSEKEIPVSRKYIPKIRKILA